MAVLAQQQQTKIFHTIVAINNKCKRDFCPKLDHGASCQVNMQRIFTLDFQPDTPAPQNLESSQIYNILHLLIFQSNAEVRFWKEYFKNKPRSSLLLHNIADNIIIIYIISRNTVFVTLINAKNVAAI